MIPRSTAIAVVAILLSFVMHFLGLGLTTRDQLQPSTEEASTNEVSLGSAFEDVVEAVTEPVLPEPTPTPEPEPEPEPIPEPESAETPTSQALVASENPQQVAAPDTGSAQVVQPETTGQPDPELGDVPEPTTIEPSNGSGSAIAETPVAPPDGADAVTEIAQGAPDEAEPAVQAVPVEPVQTPTVAPTQQLVALPSAVPVTPLEGETIEPATPTTSAEANPEQLDTPTVQNDPSDLDSPATPSLRPRLRPASVSSEPEGATDGAPEVKETRLAPSQIIESPLAAYQRDGTNAFSGRSGGARSGGIGFRNSSGPGNSDVTNYAGQVLVHLNRSRPVAVSARGWARVFFEINPDGTLASVDIIDGVGSQEIDNAAKAQVRNGEPFPRPPDGKSKKLNFVYRIQ